eukprot:scaffold27157_cov32-Prasinocladus_malaysianus.AAC.1
MRACLSWTNVKASRVCRVNPEGQPCSLLCYIHTNYYHDIVAGCYRYQHRRDVHHNRGLHLRPGHGQGEGELLLARHPHELPPGAVDVQGQREAEEGTRRQGGPRRVSGLVL